MASNVNPFKPVRLMFLFVAILLPVLLLSLVVYKVYSPLLERDAYANLQAIALLKTRQIENWLAERDGDAKVLAATPNFSMQVNQFVHGQHDAKIILNWFESLRTAYGYDGILLFDASGRQLLSQGDYEHNPTSLQGRLRQALASGRVQRGDLYHDEAGHTHLDWVVPIPDLHSGSPVAALVLRISAQHFLFPMIQTWPTMSLSAESWLIRREGESILYLNRLRHTENEPMIMKRAMTELRLPAAIALRAGKSGTTSGRDYRGVSVLSAYRPVTGTNWTMVNKIDRDEVMKPLIILILWVSIITFFFALALSLLAIKFWRQQQRVQNLVLLTQKAKAELLLRVVIDTAPIRVFWKDLNLRYLGCNTAFARDAGLATVEDIIGKDDFQLVWKNQAVLFQSDDLTVISSHAPKLNYRESQTTLDGHQIWLSTSKVPLCNNNNEVIGILGIYTDITEQKQIELQLKESENKFRLLFERSMDGILLLEDNTFIECNPAALGMLGYDSYEQFKNVSPWNISPLLQPDGRPSEEKAIEMIELARAQGHHRFEWVHLNINGDHFPVEVSLIPLVLNKREVFYVTWSDIKERKKHEQDLRIAAAAFEVQEGIMVTDANKVILRVNQSFTRISGYAAEEAIGQTPALLSSGRQDAEFYRKIWEPMASKLHWYGEIWNKRKNGEIYLEWLTITALCNPEGHITHYVGSFTDITAHKAAEEKIDRLAFHDPLTNLPNRRLLHDRLQQAFVSSTRYHRHGALLFIDLDNFKLLNDTQGHNIGDLLLLEVAERLKICVRKYDTVARLGGDEFVVLLENLDKDTQQAATQAEAICEKILTALSQPYTLKNYQCRSTASIGVCLFCDQEITAEELFKRADTAMYGAKHAGRNTSRFYDPAMQFALKARSTMESDLHLALAEDQFELYYQMQVYRNGQIIAAEVLLRWNHPKHGLVSPLEFIPLAEETGQIIAIGKWGLETACAQLKAWENDTNTRHLQLAVNVSARQFREENFVDLVCEVLRKYEINPDRLDLELSESVVLDNINDTIVKMHALKKQGVHFSMDDFGTGYSSLSYLTKLPFDKLKIDQSFIRNIGVTEVDAVVVQTIIGMAHNLGMEVIAEGVETDAQCDFLQENGCPSYQDYLFGKPVPIKEFEALLKQS